ncbi:MAG: glycosyltransferase family 4 protein [Burkholderiales bacterium]|nr:glycosyltransferase family 4 protein [Burkholderiales bacterium]
MPHTLTPPTGRLAYLTNVYPATTHTFVLREVLGLRALGWQVDTASINQDPRPLDRLTSEERVERLHTHVVKSTGWRGALAAHAWALWNHPMGYRRGLKAALGRAARVGQWAQNTLHFTGGLMLGRWMQQCGHRHVHVHFATAAASVATLARKTFPITLSMTVHGPDEFANVQLEHLGEKIATADFVVCISHFARGQSMQHSDPAHWHKMDVVRLGVAPAPLPPARPDHHCPLRLLCVGRLAPAKAQHLLLEALATLRDQGMTNVHLTLVGDGPDAHSLRQRCQALRLDSQVVFTGALNQTEVAAAYAQADAFVLPSFAEGIPVVLMEAMSRGLPCLSTRTAGIPELIEDGVSGLLAAPSDVAGLGERIRQLADSPALRQQLGQQGRERVTRDYHLGHNVARLGQVFAAHLAGVAA